MSRVPAKHSKWKILLLCGIAVLLLVSAGMLFHLHTRSLSASAAFEPDLSRQDAWTALGGTWAARTDEVDNTSEERGAKLIARLGAWRDYEVQADIKIAEPYGEAGLILRSSNEEEGVDAYHGYFAGIRTMDSTLEFGRADFGWRPLVRISLPDNIDLQGWFHLRVIAVGCTFGIVVTSPDGRTTSTTAHDDSCIPSGHFGLRSTLTSATWRNVMLKPASWDDMSRIQAQAQGANQLSPVTPFALEHARQYEDSMRSEAKKHVLLAGVQPIVNFLLSPGRHPDVTIQGVVISPPPFTDIQDDSGALIIPRVDSKLALKLGDVVEAHGTVISQRFRSRLEDAHIRVLWSEMPVPPLAVTASQLTEGAYRGRSIEVEGTLVSIISHSDGYEILLKDGNLTFRGIGSPNFQLDLPKLEIGSRLRLRGMAMSVPELTKNIYPFTVLIDHADVVSGPPWWSPQHILILVLAGIALLLLIQFAFHRLQQWHLQSVLKEREQLAFEMHDTLAQSFTGIAHQLHAASMERRGETQIRKHIGNALRIVHLSHKEASRTIAALRPQFRDAATILTALKESAERLSDGAPIQIAARLNGRNTRLPVQVTDVLFRIGQEAISNAIQHSECAVLSLDLTLSKRDAQLRIQDNGIGFDDQATYQGLGIAGMRSRADTIKARLEIRAVQGAGTTITVNALLPIAGGLFHTLRDVVGLRSKQGKLL